MTPEQVDTHCQSLPRCRRKGTAARPAWYVDDRLVARLEDDATLTVRCAFEDRERLLAEHPEVFGVPPAMERHLKVQAVLDHGHDEAVRAVLTAAYELQLRR